MASPPCTGRRAPSHLYNVYPDESALAPDAKSRAYRLPKMLCSSGGNSLKALVHCDSATGRSNINLAIGGQVSTLTNGNSINLRAQRSIYREEEDHVLRSCLILFVLLTTSTRLWSQDLLPLKPIVTPVPKGKVLPNPSVRPAGDLPYCELGYGACGGQCSSDEGKKTWNCSPDTLPCHHEGQRCTCESAAMCKQKKKKAEPSP